MFEKTFQRPDEGSQKSPITAAEELIEPMNISMKTRLIDPNSVTALELIMFDLASEIPSPRAVLLVEQLKRETATKEELGKEGWTESEITAFLELDTKFKAALEKADDRGGRMLQVKYLKLMVKALGLDDTYLTDDYVPGPADYMFFWINGKKINNVSWNGKGRLEFLQALIGSMFLQSEQTAAALNKITQG